MLAPSKPGSNAGPKNAHSCSVHAAHAVHLGHVRGQRPVLSDGRGGEQGGDDRVGGRSHADFSVPVPSRGDPSAETRVREFPCSSRVVDYSEAFQPSKRRLYPRRAGCVVIQGRTERFAKDPAERFDGTHGQRARCFALERCEGQPRLRVAKVRGNTFPDMLES